MPTVTADEAWDRLAQRVKDNPLNAGVLAFLRGADAGPAAPLRCFAVGADTPCFEGETWLFTRLGAGLPAGARARIAGGALLLAPRAGLVLALHVGRFTFFVRDDEAALGEAALVGDSLDAVTDARALGAPWRYAHSEDWEEDAALLARAFARAEATAA